MRKGRKENLLKAEDLTSEQLRERASRAGKASVEARRKKKTMKEMLEMLMYKSELSPALKNKLSEEGFDEEEMNHQLVITRSLIAKAEQGDVQAYNTICAMIGEKPAEKLDVMGRMDTKIEVGFVESEHSPKNNEDEVDV